MDAYNQLPSDRSSLETFTRTEDDARQIRQEMDAQRCAAINDETRAAIDNATALTERAAIELADLERRITEFKERVGHNPQ
jgi:hypothetical protein